MASTLLRSKLPGFRIIPSVIPPRTYTIFPCRYPQTRMISGSSIESLQRAFLDPTSPFHLREGEIGPASPGELPRSHVQSDAAQSFSTVASTPTPSECNFVEAAAEARAHALSEGHDPDSFFEQKVIWGDMDSFRHVNNTRYARFLESGRLQWMVRLAEEAGGPSASADMISGRGVGLILKSITINFKRPVLYPDTLLISHRPRSTTPPSPTHFNNDALVYSYSQRAVVATSESVLVWYDYEKLSKALPPETMREALERRMKADNV